MAKALPFSFLLQSAALLSPSAVCAALGVWQLQRREWKAGELAKRAQRLLEPPLPLSQLDASTPEWRRVRGEGELVTEAAAFVRHSRDTERGVRPAVTDACTLAPFPQVGPRVRTVGGVARSGFLLARQPAARPCADFLPMLPLTLAAPG